MVKRVGLVGVTGYTGMELTRILLGHPGLRLTQVTSRKEAGQPLQKIYPFLQGTELGELEITAPDSAFLAANCDLVFWLFLTARPWNGRRTARAWSQGR